LVARTVVFCGPRFLGSAAEKPQTEKRGLRYGLGFASAINPFNQFFAVVIVFLAESAPKIHRAGGFEKSGGESPKRSRDTLHPETSHLKPDT
jgi:hypothetical protein